MDTSDPKEVQKAVKSAKDRDSRRDTALLTIMSTPEGRMWVHDLLAKHPPMSNAFSSDALRMAFSCGEANVTQQLVADLHRVSTELYLQMMKENK